MGIFEGNNREVLLFYCIKWVEKLIYDHFKEFLYMQNLEAIKAASIQPKEAFERLIERVGRDVS